MGTPVSRIATFAHSSEACSLPLASRPSTDPEGRTSLPCCPFRYTLFTCIHILCRRTFNVRLCAVLVPPMAKKEKVG